MKFLITGCMATITAGCVALFAAKILLVIISRSERKGATTLRRRTAAIAV
jgi:hypothetical protein